MDSVGSWDQRGIGKFYNSLVRRIIITWSWAGDPDLLSDAACHRGACSGVDRGRDLSLCD
jgi:hypothetical protein